MSSAPAVAPQYLTSKEVAALLSIGQTTLRGLRQTPDFPAPVHLSPRTIRWLRSEIEEWAAARPRCHAAPWRPGNP